MKGEGRREEEGEWEGEGEVNRSQRNLVIRGTKPRPLTGTADMIRKDFVDRRVSSKTQCPKHCPDCSPVLNIVLIVLLS